MEVQVDFLGMNTALKLFPVWLVFFQAGFLCSVPSFHTESKASLIHTLFGKTVPFCKNITCMIFLLFIIAKGLAKCRLGGVISAQIVLFRALYNVGFKHFLCTNQLK